EAGVGMPYRTPPQHRHADVDLVQIAFEISDLVGNIVRALIGRGVQAVLEGHRLERRALHDRLTHDGVAPTLDLAVADDTAHVMDHERAIVAAAHVVLSSPDQLHGFTRTDGFHHLSKL